jgi:bacterioferritin (cytochrome b1)
MNFTNSLKALDRRIGSTLRALKESQARYEQEGIQNAELETTLTQCGTELRRLRKSFASILAAHAGTFEMVRYLNEALRMEYQTILDYERYVSAIEDPKLADRLREFGAEERRHAHALSIRITELGGEPKFTVAHEQRPDMTAYELLQQHLATEQASVVYYDMGLEKFDDPGFRWLIGKVKVDEEEHVRILGTLLEEYRDTALLVQESRNFKWIDPHMGKPGDRAWIE